MGFVKRVFSRPKPKPQPVVQAAPADTGKSASQIAEEQSKKNRQAALLANAGSQKSQTIGGGTPEVTRKVLLGL